MKIGRFEIVMQNKRTPSNFIALLKTIGFFSVILGMIWATIYFGMGSSIPPGVDPQSPYKYVGIDTLDDYDYYTPEPGKKPDEKLMAQNQIPEKIKELNGKQISIMGFMMPLRVDDDGKVEEFVLNGNYDRCFYGAPSQINQWIHVKMQPGAGTRATHGSVVVSGTLEVGELIEDGEVISIYRMTGDKAVAETQQRRSF